MCHSCVSIWGSADFCPLFALFQSNLAAVILLCIQRSGAGPRSLGLWVVMLGVPQIYSMGDGAAALAWCLQPLTSLSAAQPLMGRN